MILVGLFQYSKIFIGLSFLSLFSTHFSAVLKFKKQLIAVESANVFDLNGNQQPDIVSGSYWYENPGFLDRHLIGQVEYIYSTRNPDHLNKKLLKIKII